MSSISDLCLAVYGMGSMPRQQNGRLFPSLALAVTGDPEIMIDSVSERMFPRVQRPYERTRDSHHRIVLMNGMLKLADESRHELACSVFCWKAKMRAGRTPYPGVVPRHSAGDIAKTLGMRLPNTDLTGTDDAELPRGGEATDVGVQYPRGLRVAFVGSE